MLEDSPAPELPEPGDVIDDKYQVVGVVGRGGMGVVFEAVHRRLRQRVALKMLHPHVTEEPGVIERLEREARAAGQLSSANIARVLDVSTASTALPYIVMVFLEGRDLEDELSVRKQLPVHEAVDYMFQACAAMREAHSLGIIHRDLKPANMFVCPTADGATLKILDFGISKITTEADGRLTAAMTTLGSPIYMSPEQLRGASDVDARTDIWSLGVVLYELLAGRPPHAGTVTAVTAAIVTDAPPPISTHRDDVPPELEAVIAKALQKDPAERFPDARSFAEALVPFAAPANVRSLRAKLALAPAPTSSQRLAKLTDQAAEATTIVGPALAASGHSPQPGSETRHAMTTGSFDRPGHSSARMRAIAAIGAIAAVAVVLLALLWRPSSSASGGAAGAARPAIPPVTPLASASVSAVLGAASTASSSSTPPVVRASSSAPAPAVRGAGSRSAPPRSQPAATTNPLRL